MISYEQRGAGLASKQAITVVRRCLCFIQNDRLDFERKGAIMLCNNARKS